MPKPTNPAVMSGRVVVPTAARRLMASSTGEYPRRMAAPMAQAETQAPGPRTPPTRGARMTRAGSAGAGSSAVNHTEHCNAVEEEIGRFADLVASGSATDPV